MKNRLFAATFLATVIALLSITAPPESRAQSGWQPGNGNSDPPAGGTGPVTCDQLVPGLPVPRVEITSQPSERSSEVSGYIEGVCIVDAGYFVEGRQSRAFSFTTVPKFQRFEFSFKPQLNKDGEIRVYNNSGGRAIAAIPRNDRADDPLGIGVSREGF